MARAHGAGDWFMKRRSFCGVAGAAFLLSSRGKARAADLNRLKVGVISDEISRDFEKALRFLQSYGLRYVEIRYVWDTYITDADSATIAKVRSLLEKYRIQAPLIASPGFKSTLPGTQILPVDPEQYKLFDRPHSEQRPLLENAIARAHELGAEYIRIFSGWRTANPMDHIDLITEEMTKAAELAGQRKMKLALENEHACNVATGTEAGLLLDRVKHPAFGLNWDPGNCFAAGEQPYPDGYARLPKDRIWHTHLKDGVIDPATKRNRWMPVGKGQVDFDGQIRALLDDGFRGMWSLETHYRHPSGDRELATRESLEGLLEKLRRA